jgi:hypothetical protein
MTKPIPAIVETDMRRLEVEVVETYRLLQEAEGSARALEQKAAMSREAANMRRLELGRLLLRVRSAWPERGPKAKGWGEFLKRVNIDDSTAWRYIDAVKSPQTVGADPTGDISQQEKPAGPHLALVPNPAPEQPKANRDSWCTPKWLADELPAVDTDPCSNPRSHVRAVGSYSLEKGEDGLVLPWVGLVYVNGPYSNLLPWAEKLNAEYPKLKGAGFLVNADHSPTWWKVLTRHLWLRLDFDDRLEFDPPPGVEPSKNDRPQSLLMDSAFWRGCAQEALLKRGTLWELRNHGDR